MKAICVLTNVESKKIKGFIEFEIVKKNKKNMMKITLNIEGLKPGKHGFHIHEKGNLLEGCGSLCAHFNPDNTTHGDISDSKNNRHAGDLGNIIADKNGVCKQVFYDKIIKLSGKYNIIGRSVVIHENEDDLGLGGLDEEGNIIDKKLHKESLKTGNAGKRIACGIIGWK
tara:strand:- start:3900 stop:4409 length:510 start_codon:yes stop_codon:yes gene_type:complete